jgi:hypothetical protein
LPALSTFFSMATVNSPNFDLAAFRTIIKQLDGHTSPAPKEIGNHQKPPKSHALSPPATGRFASPRPLGVNF